MAALTPRETQEYHVFLASPNDMEKERRVVGGFFDQYNRSTARQWRAHFTVLDAENYATAGIGRPQELITRQTLERYRDSLALVIGLMGQRFGSQAGMYESGTEEEFDWALNNYLQTGFPEIKWFFRKIDEFKAPSDPERILEVLEQWKKVRSFRERLDKGAPQLFYKEFHDVDHFREVFRDDMSLWLAAPERLWVTARESIPAPPLTVSELPRPYYKNVVQDFQWLDIAGIDNDRSFRIPLSEMYVRLRVMLDEDSPVDVAADIYSGSPIDIQTALERYRRLVIVGDPGSGKSTFLKFIVLMIARSVLDDNPALALERLSLEAPLPIPIFISCWDLSDYLRSQPATTEALIAFIAQGLALMDSEVTPEGVRQMLDGGSCCLLFDGLDEVSTEQGRATVSRLMERCVATYGKNRFVITSRVRAYTGDTMLRGEFVRCDIQQFDQNDRSQFLKNWLALLFQKSPAEVTAEGSEGRKEFDDLISAIEHNERIRVLAVNPLLLTVVAIVHWNRKRLPEQRVELYDECVDVLLGQRKEAEHAQRSKSAGSLDEAKEEQTHYDRTWVRKRFSKIALQILLGDEEEITKGRVIEILRPRFMDRGAKNQEQADVQAEIFLDRQELKSGLLVSRRSNSYRFVHLTFQEYLAAWNLASQELKDVIPVSTPRLREPKWFETLQLLGGEWAKRSDETLDAYITYLLQQQGQTISEQAPIVALCANILKDTSGVAEIKLETRKTYDEALTNTLHAFAPNSGVPVKVQLEILEALGKLGAPVKEHLIRATKSRYFQVRSRAIDMLVPHLPDADLFHMRHILSDRSRETIKIYLSSLLDRDASRAIRVLLTERNLTSKAMDAVIGLFPRFVEAYQAKVAIDIASKRMMKMEYPWEKIPLLEAIVKFFPQQEKTWKLIIQCAREDSDAAVRRTALEAVARGRNDAAAWGLIMERVREDSDAAIRRAGLELLVTVHYKLDEQRQALLMEEEQVLPYRHRRFGPHYFDFSPHYPDSLVLHRRFEHFGHVIKEHGWLHDKDDIIYVKRYIDPRDTIDNHRVKLCATKLSVSTDQVTRMFQELSKILPLKLNPNLGQGMSTTESNKSPEC